MPLVHTRKTIATLLEPKSDAVQKAFYYKQWNNLRWRLLMRFFFSRIFMGRAGRDPQFLKQVDVSVSLYIRQKAAAHLQSGEATHNHFLHYMFTGQYGNVLPHYLKPELYDAIRANIGRLSLHQGSADEVVAMQAHDAYCLSNIFEYFPQEQFTATVGAWRDTLHSGALLLYWNLMVPRSFSDSAPEAFARIEPVGNIADAGFFYSAFLTEQKL
jgi:S-adenosylmethionine-diacylglycerol 3-amino-3-carboxypropyl transferase